MTAATCGRLRILARNAYGSQYVSPALWCTVIRTSEDQCAKTASRAPGSVSTAQTRKIESAIESVVSTVRSGWRQRLRRMRRG